MTDLKNITSKLFSACEKIHRAVQINDGDTLSRLTLNEHVIWRASGSWSNCIEITLGDLRKISESFCEVANRLREQEQQYATLLEALNEAELLLEEQGRPEGERLSKGIKIIIERAEQAASALLACQVRETELREALQGMLSLLEKGIFIRDISKDSDMLAFMQQGNEITRALKTVQESLSRSTGSKIMAVVDATKRLVPFYDENEPQTSWTGIEQCDLKPLVEAFQALEAKHD